jgi:hypothetical protein
VSAVFCSFRKRQQRCGGGAVLVVLLVLVMALVLVVALVMVVLLAV